MRTIGAIAPWFGANREECDAVGVEVGKCAWVGVPFCGGCSELPKIKTRGGVANDKHRHLINLARVIRDPELKPQLVERLEGTLFHVDELAQAQARCRKLEIAAGLLSTPEPHTVMSLDWAFDYFIVCWMGRSATPGTRSEFSGGLSTRWTASGGDSAVRFRSATDALDFWQKALAPWSFVALDAFDFLDSCKDLEDHGQYIDAPWPDDGDGYKHTFNEQDQRALAKRLGKVKTARVVIRFNDHPLIQELYPEGQWNWIRKSTRSQANKAVHEVLILNGASYA